MHTHPTDTPAIARPAGPLDQDVTCPLCEYNLRALTEPRCPECGFRFEWEELLDPDKQCLPLFFEAGRVPRVRSFISTFWMTQRPQSFWKMLSPVQPYVRRRLAIYTTAILLITILLLSTVVAGTGVWLARRIVSRVTSPWELEEALKRSRWDSPEYLAAQSRAQRIQRTAVNGQITAVIALPEFWRVWLMAVPKWIIVAAVCAVLWPGVTLLALLVFQASMRRARIRSGHIARTIVYSADVVTWTVPLFVLLSMADWLLRGLRRPWNWPDVYWYAAADNPAGPVIGTILTSPTSLVLLLGLLLGTYRLCAAYRLYLRFDQPVLTVLSSQAVTALVAVQLAAMTTWL